MLNPVEEIKSRLDIVDVIGEYLRLQKAGVNYKALCPFHSEKTPSFFVSPERQIWHCFGCGRGGDVFKFVMEIENVDFSEALKILAQKAGVQLGTYNRKLEDKKGRIFQANSYARDYFLQGLKRSRGGKEVLDYLQQRGIQKKTIENFQIGYAPYSWRGLVDFLSDKGLSAQDMIDSGLVVRSAGARGQGRLYSRFRGRIMFPMLNVASQVVAFSGRILPAVLDKLNNKDAVPKYVNSPNSLIFNKSRFLFGLDKAHAHIKREDRTILVEGHLDVVASHQAGVRNVVAPCGTALNQGHLNLLKRYSRRLVVCFDADSAGMEAAKRAISAALQEDFEVKVLELPAGKDPADIASADGEVWQRLVAEKTLPAPKFFLEVAKKKYDRRTLAGKKRIAEDVFEILAQIPSRVEQNFWMKQLSEELDISEEALLEDFGNFSLRLQPRKSEDENLHSKPDNHIEILEKNLISLFLKYPSAAFKFKEKFNPDFISHAQRRAFFKKLLKRQKKANFKITNFDQYFPENKEMINDFLLRGDYFFPDDSKAEEEIKYCLVRLKNEFFRKRLDEISRKIKIAEEKGNSKELKILQQRFSKILKLLK